MRFPFPPRGCQALIGIRPGLFQEPDPPQAPQDRPGSGQRSAGQVSRAEELWGGDTGPCDSQAPPACPPPPHILGKLEPEVAGHKPLPEASETRGPSIEHVDTGEAAPARALAFWDCQIPCTWVTSLASSG